MLLQSPKVDNSNFDHLILRPDLRFQVRERKIEVDRHQCDSRTDNVQGAIVVFSNLRE